MPFHNTLGVDLGSCFTKLNRGILRDAVVRFGFLDFLDRNLTVLSFLVFGFFFFEYCFFVSFPKRKKKENEFEIKMKSYKLDI